MALAIDRYELGPVETNCYVVRTEPSAPEAVVIDPGADATRLRLEIARMETTVVGILVTHTHYDHIGAVADLAEATGAPVYISEVEAPVLANPDAYYPGMGIRPWHASTTLSGDETIELAGISFQTVEVPGHSPGHLAYYADGSLFSGDVLFAGSVGRTDLPYADWATLVESIRALVDRFPPETTVYSGHGPPTTLGGELARNPFLAELRT
jgi:glyoxylase-like metal-dependent hydrolase (beta-lactamase superfamily II)